MILFVLNNNNGFRDILVMRKYCVYFIYVKIYIFLCVRVGKINDEIKLFYHFGII